jgi:hypothetical protein
MMARTGKSRSAGLCHVAVQAPGMLMRLTPKIVRIRYLVTRILMPMLSAVPWLYVVVFSERSRLVTVSPPKFDRNRVRLLRNRSDTDWFVWSHGVGTRELGKVPDIVTRELDKVPEIFTLFICIAVGRRCHPQYGFRLAARTDRQGVETRRRKDRRDANGRSKDRSTGQRDAD